MPDAPAIPDAAFDAGPPPPRPEDRMPCATGLCWSTDAAAPRCGSDVVREDFSSGRYSVHRYATSLRGSATTTFTLRVTAGAVAPALILVAAGGRILSDGAVPDPDGAPTVEIPEDGRTGDRAVLVVTSEEDLDAELFVTAWEEIDTAFADPMPTDVRYELLMDSDCGPLPPGAGLAPPGTLAGEVEAADTQPVTVDAVPGSPFRVDARAGEHVTFRIDFTPASADVRWEVFRYDGREAVLLKANASHDNAEWEGFRAVAVLDADASRTFWIRFHREGGAALDATLTVTRTPFSEGAVCSDDCTRMLLLPLANDTSAGYDVPGHTIYTFQYGRRELIMAIRHAGRRMAAAGYRFTVKDLSRWDGAVWDDHSTHDEGRHADISLFTGGGEPVWQVLCTQTGNATDGYYCLPGSLGDFDAEPMARMVDALFDSGRLIWVLLDREYHASLLAAVDALVADSVIAPDRRELFDATTPACAGRPCVRHVVFHHHHVHIGFAP